MGQVDEGQFLKRAGETIRHLEQVLEESGFDVEMGGDGILEVDFDNGSKIVINAHRVAREVWIAARSGGFHFRWQDGHWVDTRDGAELFARLSTLVSDQSGGSVALR